MELATREGARYAGIDAGVLAPGRLADVAVVEPVQRPHAPLHRTVAGLRLLGARLRCGDDRRRGAVVYEDGRCLLVDEQALWRRPTPGCRARRPGGMRHDESVAPAAFGVDVERLR